MAKLPYLEEWHTKRQQNAAYYDDRLQAIDQVQTPMIAAKREHHIYNQYVLRVPDRDGLRERLSERNIGSEIYYPVPFHLQECFMYLGYQQGDFPEAEAAAAETVAIPIYPELTEEMQDYVIGTIEEYYG